MKRKYTFKEMKNVYADITAINAILTATIVTIVSAVLMLYVQEIRNGLFTIGFEYVIIGLVAGFTPIALLKLESILFER